MNGISLDDVYAFFAANPVMRSANFFLTIALNVSTFSTEYFHSCSVN